MSRVLLVFGRVRLDDGLGHFAPAALGLGGRMLGRTGVNPAVGCVLSREGRVLGRGATGSGGRPHAEEVALSDLAASGLDASGSDVVTTLEPCAHARPGGSCSARLVEAGVGRVLYLLPDVDSRTSGRGAAGLRAGGVEVFRETRLEVLALAYALCLGHVVRTVSGRASVTLKLASSLDGRISRGGAAGDGKKIAWVTGELARRRAHLLRAEHDGILVGSGTVLSDDPLLSVRLPGWRGSQPVRLVLDGRLRVPASSRVLARNGSEGGSGDGAGESGPPFQATWIFTREDASCEKARALSSLPGVRVIPTPLDGSCAGSSDEESSSEGLDLRFVLEHAAKAGLSRILAEGGAGIASSLLSSDLVDCLAWFHAPRVLGAAGRSAVPIPLAGGGALWHCFSEESWDMDRLSLFLSPRHYESVLGFARGGLDV